MYRVSSFVYTVLELQYSVPGGLKAKQDWVLKRGGVLEPLALTVIQQVASACSNLQLQQTREETLLD